MPLLLCDSSFEIDSTTPPLSMVLLSAIRSAKKLILPPITYKHQYLSLPLKNIHPWPIIQTFIFL